MITITTSGLAYASAWIAGGSFLLAIYEFFGNNVNSDRRAFNLLKGFALFGVIFVILTAISSTPAA